MAPGTALVLSLLSLVLAQACGSIGRPSSGLSSTAPSSSAPVASAPAGNPARQTVAALTDADSGRTVRMQKGQVISVALHEANGFTPWSRLATSDGGVLTPIVDTRAAAVRGVTLASFEGVAPGTAQLTSSASQDCAAGAQCPALARGWTVTVIVS
ncbi:hypothetical protein [Candidatus Nephthysia bennettiae]|uniref:hypothetical protein n=1 Tax=Candidatus Nephthysia bennettiae TaxID=3127016 RepID=UPI001A2E24B7|nr:hypothetical protein [Candidatus Dormibacteraeota bacterium]